MAVPGGQTVVVAPDELSWIGVGARWRYHGTLLLSADLAALEHLLYIDGAGSNTVSIQGRDTASVRAPRGVVNLSQLVASPVDHDAACQAIAEQWATQTGRRLEVVELPFDEVLAGDNTVPGAAAEAEKFRSNEWVFGGSPPFSARISGSVPDHAANQVHPDVTIEVKRGCIVGVSIDRNHACAIDAAKHEQLLLRSIVGLPFLSRSFGAAATRIADASEITSSFGSLLDHCCQQMRSIE